MEGLYTDVIFKGFFQSYDDGVMTSGPNNTRHTSNNNAFIGDQFGNPNHLSGHLSQQSLSDNEEMRDGGSPGSGNQIFHQSSNEINIDNSDIRFGQDHNQLNANNATH